MSDIVSKIEAVSFVHPYRYTNEGYISCAQRAARKCLSKMDMNEIFVDMIISTAIFRDQHVVEPALSALIANGLIRPSLFFKRNFKNQLKNIISFDLNNGVCGVIQAIQLVDGFIRSGRINSGIILTGDSANNTGITNSYFIKKGVGALLLSKSSGNEGFTYFNSKTFHEYRKDSIATSYFSDNGIELTVEEDEEFSVNASECVCRSFEQTLDETQNNPKDIDLIICSQYPNQAIVQLGNKFGIMGKTVTYNTGSLRYHTAAPLFALSSVYNSSRFKSAKKILFITVGAGITTSVALYNKQEQYG